MKLKLVSMDLCPYVQRTVILLKHKGAPFEVDYIDLENPPAWFRKMSPTGRVPLLRVDDRVTLFESLVIMEYVDETVGEPLLPPDPLERARERAWMNFSSALLVHLWEGDQAEIADDLSRFEEELGKGRFFSGPRFGLVDAAIGPFFLRLEQHGGVPANLPKVRAWAHELLALPEVKTSVPADFVERYRALAEL
jgi:glutathione S-transferase